MQQILIIGFGSIGQRHFANLQAIGNNEISIVSNKPLMNDNIKAIFKSIDNAYSKNKFDTVIICTPTAQHIHDLQTVWNYGARKIYVEKPISNNYLHIQDFSKKIRAEKCQIVIGYDLHFDPGFMKVKELVEKNVIGKVLSANATVGQYLPDWRPNEDHKKGMSASIMKGGGVMLDLIHELDYLYNLFGRVHYITAQKINSGCLEIETEELAEILLKFKNGTLATVHLDYLQPALLRNCRLTGTQGSIVWNMAKTEVKWITLDKKEFIYTYNSFSRNERFKEILKTFLMDHNDDRLCSFEQATESLKMIIAAKKAAEERKYIDLENYTF